MDGFTAHFSKGRTLVMIAAALGFVAAGCWMVGLFGPAPVSERFGPAKTLIAGWAGILFFGLCALIFVRRLINDQPALRITPSGIQAAQWSDDTIPWSQITDVTTWTHRTQTMIVLHLRNPEMFPGRGLAGMLAKANRGLTGGDVAITLTGTNRSLDDALAAIAQYLPR